MLKRVALAAACAAVLASVVYAKPRPAPPPPAVLALGTADSVKIVLAWQPVLDAKGRPVDRYLWKIQSGPTVLAADSTAALADTFAMARPAAGDTLTVTGAVAARDSRGMLSAWGTSAPIKIPGKPWTPPPAPAPGIDTLALTAPDSALIALERSTGIPTIDGNYRITERDTIDFCGYVWRAGRLAPSTAVSDWSVGNPVVLSDLGTTPSRAYCHRFVANVATGVQMRRVLHYASSRPSLIARWFGLG